jgi:hypothetical protein
MKDFAAQTLRKNGTDANFNDQEISCLRDFAAETPEKNGIDDIITSPENFPE